jgi:FlgD Ig-like domain
MKLQSFAKPFLGLFILSVFILSAPPAVFGSTTIGGGGHGEWVERNGVWAFDILSNTQHEGTGNCENTVFSPFGNDFAEFGWLPWPDGTAFPHFEPVLPGQFGTNDSQDVGGVALFFNDVELGGFPPFHLSLMESPPIDVISLGLYPGTISFGFSANSLPMPPALVFVVGSRVFTESGGWSPWIDVDLPIQSGPHDYRVPLAYNINNDVVQLQNRVGVKNNDNQQVPGEGPAVDRAENEAKEETVQGSSTWKYVPDISQGSEAICQGSAFANCLIYWSQNGYSELAPSEGTQEEKNEEVQDDVVEECHTNDYGDAGATKYMKGKGVYKGQPKTGDRPQLEHKRLSNTAATWDTLAAEFSACHDVLLRLQWYNEDGELVDENAAHYVTIAGIEVTATGEKKIHVANPWGESHHEPTEDTRDDAYDTLEVTVGDDGRIRVDNEELETRALGIEGAEYLCVNNINIIRPVAEDGFAKAAASQMLQPGPSQRDPQTFTYTINNDEDFTPMNYAAIMVEVPYSNVQVPPGWGWEPLPFPYPDTTGCGDLISPSGILWYTTTDPILPGDSLGGFSFDAEDSYTTDPEGLIWYIETEGQIGTYGFVIGPVPGGSSSAPDPLSTPIEFLAASPNPFRDHTEIAFQLAVAELVRIDVYDISGRLVQTLANNVFSPGAHRVIWDGSTREGTQASPGVYFARSSRQSGGVRLMRLSFEGGE